MLTPDTSWSHLNAGPETLSVWLEPWAEEFDVSSGSTILVRSSNGGALGEVERVKDHFTIWATASKVEVFIDGVLQDTASSQIAFPDGLTKQMLTVVFAGRPEARLGGEGGTATGRASFWRRATNFLRW